MSLEAVARGLSSQSGDLRRDPPRDLPVVNRGAIWDHVAWAFLF